MKEKIIFHIDVNNAFLSWTAVKMLKDGVKQDIRVLYAVIAGNELERRGIVLAKSNLCKKVGIKTAESLYSARRKCPNLVVYPPDFDTYTLYSKLLFDYLSKYSPLIEQYSIDECFIDYTDSINLFGEPLVVAEKIRKDIKEQFGFTVNIGIGNNKLCAKMASDFEKPDKIHTLFKNELSTKLWPLPIGDLFMIGHRTAEKLIGLNINTIGDLAHSDFNLLKRYFNKMAITMKEFANGIDNSPVESEYASQKSIGSSTVLPYDYTDRKAINRVIRTLAEDIGNRLRKNNCYASVVVIGIKYSDFSKSTKQLKLNNDIDTDEEIYKTGLLLFEKIWNGDAIRHLSLTVKDFTNSYSAQLSLFDEVKPHNEELQKTIDQIRTKYGKDKIIFADSIDKKP